MRTVYKYPLDHPVTEYELPADCKILCIHEQDSTVMVWVELETESKAPITVKRFTIVGTGREIPRGSQYVGTAFIDLMVWHVYKHENGKKEKTT